MENPNIQKKKDTYIEIFNQLRKSLKWQAESNVLSMVASIYVINNKKFDLQELLEVSDYIKGQVGIFSPLRSHQKYTTAAMLIGKFDEPKKKFNELLDHQEKLLAGGFKKGPYTSIAALALMTSHGTKESLEDRISKALDVYKGMKSHHFFLTNQGDYPLAVLLSQSEQSIDDLMGSIEGFYGRLSEGMFRKGNDLQFLSHILLLLNHDKEQEIISRCDQIYKELKERGLKIRAMHYPQIGLMSILEDNRSEEIMAIKELSDTLNRQKGMKWIKDINLMMAIIFVMAEKLGHDTIIEMGISTTIEAVIQAQHAAVMAAVASTSAATSSAT